MGYAIYSSPIEEPEPHRFHPQVSLERRGRHAGFHLEPNERILRVVSPHWTSVLPEIAMFIVVAAIPVLINRFGLISISLCVLIVFAVMILAVLVVFASYVSLRANKLVITDRRVIFRKGLIDRDLREFALRQIAKVAAEHDIGQDLMGTGTLTLDITGSQHPEILPNIKAPHEVVDLLSRLINAAGKGVADKPVDHARSVDPLERIRELAKLLEEGLITDEEFHEAKHRILRSL